MAGTVYISEAEAARDFAAVMRHVRDGDDVVVEDAGVPIAVLRSAGASGEAGEPVRLRGKTAEEVAEGFRRWEAENGPLVLDEDFVKDMDEIHRRYNMPLESRWD
jgi:antitoxin (DNA-binding transcriptional repressor) of toxin-antitoxin stability system